MSFAGEFHRLSMLACATGLVEEKTYPNLFTTKCFQSISTTIIHAFLSGTVVMVFVSVVISDSHTCFCA